MGASRADKEAYFTKLKELIAKYCELHLVNLDPVLIISSVDLHCQC